MKVSSLQVAPVMHENMRIVSDSQKVPDKHEKKDTIFNGKEARQQLQQLTAGNRNMQERLMEEQAALHERRSELIERTLEKGDDLSSIQEQLETIDEQIQQVEQALVKERAIDHEALLGKDEEVVEQTEEESVMQSATTYEQLKTIQQTKNYVERESRTIRSEIQQDQRFGISTEEKEEKLASLEQRLSNISEKMTELFENDRSSITIEEPNEEREE